MKKRYLIFICAAAIICYFLAMRFQTPKTVASLEPSGSETNSEATISTTASTPARSPSPNIPQKLTEAESQYRQGLIGKEQAMQETLLERNNQSLDLYGKVVDQYGEPVAGATIEGSVLLNVDMTRSGGETNVTQTDSQGQFSFVGLHGVKLGVWPLKEGYIYDLKLPSRRPDDYQPDPANPVVFTMWKLKGAEPLIHEGFQGRIPYDGTAVAFDLQTGKKAADGNGDFRVVLVRTPLQIRRGRDKI